MDTELISQTVGENLLENILLNDSLLSDSMMPNYYPNLLSVPYEDLKTNKNITFKQFNQNHDIGQPVPRIAGNFFRDFGLPS